VVRQHNANSTLIALALKLPYSEGINTI